MWEKLFKKDTFLVGILMGIIFPAIGFSLMDYMPDADFSHVEEWVMKITKKVLDDGLPEGVCLNVNIPRISENSIKGIKVCQQAKARWVEEFEERKDPYGRTYYWLTKPVYLEKVVHSNTE